MIPVFSQLFESVPDALLVVGRDGRIELANENAERLFGYASGQLNGLSIEELVPAGARERHRGHRERYMHQPRVRPMGGANMTLVGQRRDGQQFPVEIALSPLESNDEAPRYLASVRDISETQRARQALARARYDTVLARIGQLALASTDEDSVIGRLPGLLAEVMDVPVVAVVVVRGEEAVISAQTGLRSADPADPQWLSLEQGPLQRVLQSGQPVLVQSPELPGAPNPWPVETASAALIPLLDRSRPMGALVALSPQPARFDHDALQLLQQTGNLVSALMQRRRTEEQLAHAQRLEAVGQLTGGVAHDFNNLLTVLSGSLQLLEMECEGQRDACEIISSALRSVERGTELTSKLLAFARRQHLSPRVIDAGALLADLERMLRRTLGETVVLRIDCQPGLSPLYADASQLDSALVNLALNARDAMPGGGEITITARERWVTAEPSTPGQRPGHYIAFTVADTGHGMSPAVLARAFEPFFTTKAIGRGSGLGLSMVYGFVSQSGGYMHIHSEPRQGTRVELFLPVASADSAMREAPAPDVDVRGSEAILLVEDEADVRAIGGAFLRSLGYDVVEVGSAADALERLASREDFALIFSDVMLGGGMNGMELAQAAQALRPHIGVLLTSGYDDPSIQIESPQRFELLRKPYRREALATAIRRNIQAPPQP